MNALWLRIFKSAYRREPITSFVVTVGAVDALIGGVGTSWSLLSFGVGTVGIAIVLRAWQMQKSQTDEAETAPEYYLPPSSSRPQLPVLKTNPKRRPPY